MKPSQNKVQASIPPSAFGEVAGPNRRRRHPLLFSLLRGTCVVISLALAMVSLALWRMSYVGPPLFLHDIQAWHFSMDSAVPPRWNVWIELNPPASLDVSARSGVLDVSYFRDLPAPWPEEQHEYKIGRFLVSKRTMGGGYHGGAFVVVTCKAPLWVPSFGFLFYPAPWYWLGPHRRRKRRGAGLCLTCGYNLTGLPEPRCPECGTLFDGAATPRAQGFRA